MPHCSNVQIWRFRPFSVCAGRFSRGAGVEPAWRKGLGVDQRGTDARNGAVRGAGEPPLAQGMYDPRHEHDACGLGFIAHIKGRKTHGVITQGLAILENLTHRGATGADPLQGDNNAAVFRDASIDSVTTRELLDSINVNLALAVGACATAVRRSWPPARRHDRQVTPHQARLAVPGCTPYVTAKAATEGLTRGLAVEYGTRGIRVNAVDRGRSPPIATTRKRRQPPGWPSGSSARHPPDPVGRAGRPRGGRGDGRRPPPTRRASSPAPPSLSTVGAPSSPTTPSPDGDHPPLRRHPRPTTTWCARGNERLIGRAPDCSRTTARRCGS